MLFVNVGFDSMQDEHHIDLIWPRQYTSTYEYLCIYMLEVVNEYPHQISSMLAIHQYQECNRKQCNLKNRIHG